MYGDQTDPMLRMFDKSVHVYMGLVYVKCWVPRIYARTYCRWKRHRMVTRFSRRSKQDGAIKIALKPGFENRTSELLQHQVGEAGIAFSDMHGILQTRHPAAPSA